MTSAGIELPQGTPIFAAYFDSISESSTGNGVFLHGDLKVTATSNAMEIQVSSGDVWFDGSVYSVGSANTHSIASADSTYDRWDAVVYDTSLSTPTTSVVKGTAESNPTPPMPGDAQLPLAFIYVPAGASDIVDNRIHNWRTHAQRASHAYLFDADGHYTADTVEGALDEAVDKFVDSDGDTISGALNLPSDPGIFGPVVDVPVTSSSNSGDMHRYGFMVDGNMGLEVRGEADGSGGIRYIELDASYAAGFFMPSVMVDGDIRDNSTGAFIYDASAGHVPRAQVDDKQKTASVSANTLTADEEVIFGDSSGGAITITLASADAADGNEITIKDSAGAAGTNSITVDTENSETIDGSSSITLSSNYDSVTVVSDGTNWYTV